MTYGQSRSSGKWHAIENDAARCGARVIVAATRDDEPTQRERCRNCWRPASTYEAPDIAAMISRMARGLARRAGQGELEALAALAAGEHALHDALAEAAAAAHDGPFAYSWNQIGDQLGMTRQAAQQRFGKRQSA